LIPRFSQIHSFLSQKKKKRLCSSHFIVWCSSTSSEDWSFEFRWIWIKFLFFFFFFFL